MRIGRTFRGKLLTSFLLLTAFTILIMFHYGLYFMKKKDRINETLMLINNLKVNYIQDIKIQSDFIRFDATDTLFHMVGTSKNLYLHDSVYKQIDELLRNISNNKFTGRLGIQSDLDSLKLLKHAMSREFDKIVTIIKIRGFKDYGVEGLMRNYAHILENSEADQELLLTLRRHEKDYIIRKEPQYIDKLNKTGSVLKSDIMLREDFSPRLKDSLIEIANIYLNQFNYLVNIEEEIGLYKNTGIKQDLETIFSKSEYVINNIVEKANQEKSTMIRDLELNSVWFFSLLILMNILISIYLSTHITNPLKELTTFISNITKTNFGSNDLPSIKNADNEINILVSEFRKMVEHLRSREVERDTAELALRENETKYRNLADLLPQSIFETDSECVLTYFNRTMADTFGLNESALESNLKITEILNTSCETLLKNENSSAIDFTARKKDGEEFPVLLYVSSILRNGELEGLRGIMVDITEKIRYTEELKTQKLKAEQADKLKSAFLANMSHEIRTPMNSIVGFSQILTQPDLDNESRLEYAEYISNSSDLLLKIINDILDVAKIESGQFKVSFSNFDLNSLMNKVGVQANEMKKTRNKTHLEIRIIKYYLNKEFIINSDQHRLEQVLMNLINNAIKFTQNGLIETGYRITEHKTIEFYVKDTGIGIPQDKTDIVFERFTQVEEIKNKHYEGTGLGLSICKSIIDLLGGRIWVESIFGTGSVFYFEIPLSVNYFIKDEESYSDILEFPAHFFNDVKILIAEDVEYNYLFLRESLKPYNMLLYRALNGAEAIEMIKTNRDIKIVLMDMKMPVMDGYEASRQIKILDTGIKIIATTAYAMSGEKEKCMEAGCDSYISKPITIKTLIRIIGRHLFMNKDLQFKAVYN